MHKLLAATGLLCLVTLPVTAAPTAATYISKEDYEKVMKLDPKANDHTLRVIDMGQNYNMAVGIVKRPPTNAQTGTPANANAAAKPCGVTTPINGKVGPSGMQAHDSTAETYIILAGGGTLVTGGKILDGKRSAPEAPVTTTLNGPTCGGKVTGDYVSRVVKAGDIVVVPAGVPHGWIDSPGVTFISVRPDPAHVLPKAGYKYPGL